MSDLRNEKKFDLLTEIGWETERELQVGDTIRCHDADDMINAMTELSRSGIETDWDPEETKLGIYILHVTEVKK